MIDPQRRDKLMKAQARIWAAIKDLEPEEQDHVLESHLKLISYSRPVVVSETPPEVRGARGGPV